MLFGSIFGATLVGLTEVKGTTVVKGKRRNLIRKKGANKHRAELKFGPGVLQIKDSSVWNLRRERTKEENLLARNNIAR